MRLLLLLVASLALAECVVSSTSGAGGDPDRLDALVRTLEDTDHVFVGRLLGQQDTILELRSTCGQIEAGRLPLTDLQIAVEEVWGGDPGSDTVLVRCARGWHGGSSPRVGDRLLARAVRHCADGWSLWGSAAPIDGAGALHAELFSAIDLETASLTFEEVRSEFFLSRAHLSRAYQGLLGLALVTITRIEPVSSAPGNREIEAHRVLVRALPGRYLASATPDSIVFTRSSRGHALPQAGDTLLVPIAARPPAGLFVVRAPVGVALVRNGCWVLTGSRIESILDRFESREGSLSFPRTRQQSPGPRD